jgi:hypothetical protein
VTLGSDQWRFRGQQQQQQQEMLSNREYSPWKRRRNFKCISKRHKVLSVSEFVASGGGWSEKVVQNAQRRVESISLQADKKESRIAQFSPVTFLYHFQFQLSRIYRINKKINDAPL